MSMLRSLGIAFLVGMCLQYACTGSSAEPTTIVLLNMDDQPPGWTESPSGAWEWGTPSGTCGDPSAGHTGTKVAGYALTGCYENSLSSRNLSIGPFDCSRYANVKVKFWRWLRVARAYYDHAGFQVSNNNSTWVSVWENPLDVDVLDAAWTLCEYDITATAAGKATVYLRWVMGPTDSVDSYGGWNLDDVELTNEPPPPYLHHFECSAVSSPRYAGVPFPMTITARLSNGETMTDFNECLEISQSLPVSKIIMYERKVNSQHFAAALAELGLVAEDCATASDFYTALAAANPADTLAILNCSSASITPDTLITFIAAGGRVIFSWWDLDTEPGLTASFEAQVAADNRSPVPLYDWGGSPFFDGLTSPLPFSDTWPDNGDYLTPIGGAFAVAGFVSAQTSGHAAIVIGNSGRTVLNGFLFDDVTQATDAIRLAKNEIAFLATTTAVTVSPATVCLVNGVWQGTFTVNEPAEAFRIRVADTSGHRGDTDAFDVLPPPPVTVTLPASTAENAGTLAGQGSVTIPVALGADLTVQLSSSDTAELTVPDSVVISAGAMSVAFDITIVNDALLDGTRSVTITPSAEAHTPVAASIIVHDDETAVLGLILPAEAAEKAGTLAGQGKLTVSSAPDIDLIVFLTSSDSTEVAVPASVAVPAGGTEATFDLSIIDDQLIDGSQSATITAHVENWTDGSCAITVLDDESLALTVTLPDGVWEGESKAGTVGVNGITLSDLLVSLTTDTPGELTVPETITIPSGQQSVDFTVTTQADDVCDGGKTVSVTASLGDNQASASTRVLDSNVHYFMFGGILSPRTAGVPFSITVSAVNIDGLTITPYVGAASLKADADQGALSIQPQQTGPFSSGQWTGTITIAAVASNARLTASSPSDPSITGTSTAFDLEPGPLHHFTWDAVPSPQVADEPFHASLTAQDANGFTVTGFNETVAISGAKGSESTEVVIGTGTSTYYYPLPLSYNRSRTQVIYLASEIGGPRLLSGLSLMLDSVPTQTINQWTIRMKHTALASYSSPASWEGSGWTVVYQANETITSSGWVSFPFTTPFVYDGIQNLMIDFSFNNSSTTSNVYCGRTTTSDYRLLYYRTSTSTYGDPLLWSGTSSPTPSRVPYQLNIKLNCLTLPASPLSVTFSAGRWSGDATVLEAAENAFLTAIHQSGAQGRTNYFDVLPPRQAPPVMNAEPAETQGACNTVAWSAVPNAHDYLVEYDDDPSFPTPDGSSGWVAALEHQFCGLTDGTTYYYRAKCRRLSHGRERLWSQTSQVEFNAGSLTGVMAVSPGDVVLMQGTQQVTDTLGGTTSSSSGGTRARFNAFQCQASRILTNIEVYLDLPSSIPLQYLVYECDAASGDYACISRTLVSGQTGTGIGFYSSGPVAVPLTAGKYYLIGAAWNDSITYYYKTSGHPTSTAFGSSSGNLLYNDGYPPPDTIHYSLAGSNVYHFRLTTVLSTSSGPGTGSVVSPPINRAQLVCWDTLTYGATVPAGTTLTVDVLDASGQVLAASVPSGSSLSTLGITQTAIKLRADMASTSTDVTPVLHDWCVTWRETSDTAVESSWSEAVFSQQEVMHVLSVSSDPPAAVAIQGDKPGTAPYTALCDHGQDVRLTAPQRCVLGERVYEFAHWTVDGTPAQENVPGLTIRMDNDLGVTAVYTIVPRQLIIEGPTERGEGPLLLENGVIRFDFYARGIVDFAGVQAVLSTLGPQGTSAGTFQISVAGGNPPSDAQAIVCNSALFGPLYPVFVSQPLMPFYRQLAGFVLLSAGSDLPEKTWLMSVTYDYTVPVRYAGTFTFGVNTQNTLLASDNGVVPFDAVPGHAEFAKWPIPGDANCDCTVNILDLIDVRKKLGQPVDSGDNWKADLNNDGMINLLDLIVIRSKLASRCDAPLTARDCGTAHILQDIWTDRAEIVITLGPLALGDDPPDVVTVFLNGETRLADFPLGTTSIPVRLDSGRNCLTIKAVSGGSDGRADLLVVFGNAIAGEQVQMISIQPGSEANCSVSR
ncbi:MAG TPA: dockerin type I repeat-containing protein [Planctomycetota bacterium]|nr:dockerin type I repeat-containing protein [Planctomycetota bacterium]